MVFEFSKDELRNMIDNITARACDKCRHEWDGAYCRQFCSLRKDVIDVLLEGVKDEL